MAEIRSIYTDSRKSRGRRKPEVVSGTAVRKTAHMETAPREQRVRQPQVRHGRSAGREHLSIGYTLFLSAACALTLWVCAGYLQLQADNTARIKNIAVLEAELSALRTENDDEYNRVVTGVNLEEIRDIAVHELGMVYAAEDQIVLYDSKGNDYVKQYAQIPEKESDMKALLGTWK